MRLTAEAVKVVKKFVVCPRKQHWILKRESFRKALETARISNIQHTHIPYTY